MKRLGTIFCLFVFLVPLLGSAKPDKNDRKQIEQVIQNLFDGMRKADSSLVRPLFHPDAVMGSIGVNKDTKTFFRFEGKPEGFISAVGTPHADIWDERIGKMSIAIDGEMATAWVPYQFYRGSVFSHCGVNAFTLVKLETGWVIVSIIDTRRKSPCKK
jgi:Putative lumazine-binding